MTQGPWSWSWVREQDVLWVGGESDLIFGRMWLGYIMLGI